MFVEAPEMCPCQLCPSPFSCLPLPRNISRCIPDHFKQSQAHASAWASAPTLSH